MSQTPLVPPYVNRAMKLVLCSPTPVMVRETLLLITFTGRKGGKTHSTPVNYSQFGDQAIIFTHTTWWKNLLNSGLATLRLRSRESQGLAEAAAEDKGATADGLIVHLRKVLCVARYDGVTLGNHKTPKAEEIYEAERAVGLSHVWLCDPQCGGA